MATRFAPIRGSAILGSIARGPTGAAATVEVGDITTLAPGADPTVENVGTVAAAILDFGIPTTPTIAVGTTTTKAAGTAATAVNSGTAAVQVYDFGIPRGADAGLRYAFETSTSMAAPASGGVRFNNATPASITAIAINAIDADGNTVRPYMLTWDDSTNTAQGAIVFKREADGTAIILLINGTITDNTTWLQIPVTWSSGATLFSASDPVYVRPDITGNKGADGSVTGSTGSVDNAIIRANGTGGNTIQASAPLIDDSGNITPVTNDASGLGTSLVKWADLFLASGGVINWNSGNITITHSAGNLSLAGGTLTLPNTGLHLLDTGGTTFDLIIKPGSALSADRTFTITTGDADRSLTLNGNATLTSGTAAVISGAQTLTGGFKVTPYAAGTKSSGTYTPLYSDGNFQTATNGGAHTLAPPADDCSIIVQYTNNASAGAITTSGFTKKTGDSITTVNGDDFFFFIVKVGSFSHLHVQALQ